MEIGLSRGSTGHLQALYMQCKALNTSQQSCLEALQAKAELENELAKLQEQRKRLVLGLEELHDGRDRQGRSYGKRRDCRDDGDDYEIVRLDEKIARKLQRGHGSDMVDETSDDLDDLKKLLMSSTAGTLEHRELVNLMICYRLCGVSLFSTKQADDVKHEDNDAIGIRWDTSYRGEYYEQFYVIFKRRSNALIIYRHSLPHFVPVQAIWDQHDMKGFVKSVGAYLNAFVSRREQLNQVVSRFGGEHSMKIDASLTRDRVEIRGLDTPRMEKINVWYHSLLDTVPSRLTVTTNDEDQLDVELSKDSISNLTLADLIEECIDLYST